MSSELTIINNQTTDLALGGQGIDLQNKLFKIKPATLTIVQPQSQSGGTKGNLRIIETSEEFETMNVSLLIVPRESRNYYIGEQGELNRTPENLLCFSTDMIRPHPRAKVPQALNCAGCSKGDWKPYNEYRNKNGKANKALIPPCASQYTVYLIDTVYQIPLRMFVRSKAKEYFEAGTQNIARLIMKARAQKQNPNLYDVQVTLSTKLVTQGNYKYYVPILSDPKFITAEQRVAFGEIYKSFIESQNKPDNQNQEAIQEAQTEINNAVTEGEYVSDDQEITI